MYVGQNLLVAQRFGARDLQLEALQALCDTCTKAGMAELADAADSKSADLRVLGVQLPLPAPTEFLCPNSQNLSSVLISAASHEPQSIGITPYNLASCPLRIRATRPFS